MTDFVINLLDGATDFSWASVKGRHSVLLCQKEQGEILGWAETETNRQGAKGPCSNNVEIKH